MWILLVLVPTVQQARGCLFRRPSNKAAGFASLQADHHFIAIRVRASSAIDIRATSQAGYQTAHKQLAAGRYCGEPSSSDMQETVSWRRAFELDLSLWLRCFYHLVGKPNTPTNESCSGHTLSDRQTTRLLPQPQRKPQPVSSPLSSLTVSGGRLSSPKQSGEPLPPTTCLASVLKHLVESNLVVKQPRQYLGPVQH